MNHKDIVTLLKKAVPYGPSRWLELGSGDGAFTLALASLAGPRAEIYSVDKDPLRLELQRRKFVQPERSIRFIQQDFMEPLNVPLMDGILMANALHYIKDKEGLLRRLRGILKPEGRLVVVEYDTDRGNPWVPYPIKPESLESTLKSAGFVSSQIIATTSAARFEEMYAMMALIMDNAAQASV